MRMDTELYWVVLALIIIFGVMMIAIAMIFVDSVPAYGRKHPYAGTNWYVELWNISYGYQVELRFTNTYVMGRMSLHDNIMGRRPMEFDPTISREHCMVYEQDGMLLAWNMSAVNVAMLNGYRLNQPAQIFPGDRLELGNSVFLITRVERI